MFWDEIRECCSLIMGSLDGRFGWFSDITTIAIIVLLFNFLFKRLLIFLEKYFKAHNKPLEQSLVSALYLPLSYYIWFFAAIETADFITHQIFGDSVLPYKQLLLGITIVLSFTWFAFRWKRNAISAIKARDRSEKTPHGIAQIDLVDKLATVVILIIAMMLLLEVTGNSLNTLIAFGGISGLALAFASQEVIASFFGGLMVYLTHPFVIGDWIILPERSIEGHVEEIGWYTTKVRTFDKRPIYVPNSIFSKVVVINPSRMSHRQVKETIGIRYRDVGELKGIIADIRQVLASSPDIDQDMTYGVFFTAFGDYSLDILFSAYTFETTTNGFNRIKEGLLFSIIEILAKHKAELAFPTTCIETIPAIFPKIVGAERKPHVDMA